MASYIIVCTGEGLQQNKFGRIAAEEKAPAGTLRRNCSREKRFGGIAAAESFRQNQSGATVSVKWIQICLLINGAEELCQQFDGILNVIQMADFAW